MPFGATLAFCRGAAFSPPVGPAGNGLLTAGASFEPPLAPGSSPALPNIFRNVAKKLPSFLRSSGGGFGTFACSSFLSLAFPTEKPATPSDFPFSVGFSSSELLSSLLAALDLTSVPSTSPRPMDGFSLCFSAASSSLSLLPSSLPFLDFAS
jgi:hypothetical protein